MSINELSTKKYFCDPIDKARKNVIISGVNAIDERTGASRITKTTGKQTMEKQKITNDDWARYFVGPDWNKTMVIGSKRAAKISYELGCTAIDREGAIYCAAVTDGMRGTPRLFRVHK